MQVRFHVRCTCSTMGGMNYNDERFQPQGDGNQDETLGDQQWNEVEAPPAWAAGEPMAVRAEKPPIIPFSPLDVGQLMSGMIAAVRANPKVMFTISLATMAVLGLLAAILSLFTETTVTTDVTSSGASYTFVGGTTSVWASVAETIMDLLVPAASVLVAGALVLTVTNAIIGRDLSLATTLELLKERAWKLIGTAVLVWLIMFGVIMALVFIGVVVAVVAFGPNGTFSGAVAVLGLIYILAGIAVFAWLSVRLYYSTMVAVVEEASPGQALKRSWQLTSGAFWRTLGRIILLTIVIGIATGILSGVVGLLTGFIHGAAGTFITVFLASLVSGVVMPFSASYDSLMYVDQRIRSENLGPVLQSAWEASR